MRFFTNDEHRRVLAAAQRLADMPDPDGSPRDSAPSIETLARENRFPAKITAVYHATNGYAWKLVAPDPANPGRYVDAVPATTGSNAWHIGGARDIAVNTVVTLSVESYESGGTPRFTFGTSGGGPGWFRISGNTQDATNRRWTYSARRATKTTAGFTWAIDLTDVTVYTLRNTIETPNDGITSMYGNGIDIDNLYDVPGYNVVPIGAGAVVLAWPVTFTVAGIPTTEYWFSAVNQVDGNCSG